MSYNTFHLFPILPTELRLKVWIFAFPGPRVLEIIWRGEWLCAHESRCKPNFAPFANREANGLFLEKWFRLTLRQFPGSSGAASCVTVSYFNPEIDTLYVGATSARYYPQTLKPKAVDALGSMEISRYLRFLAFEIREWHGEPDDFRDNWELDFFARFPKLDCFIIADYDIDWSWIHMKYTRVMGEIEFVSPIQMDMKNLEEMAPHMIKRLADLSRSHPESNIPPATVKEVLRGGVRMTFT
jgi:hypothetical protein